MKIDQKNNITGSVHPDLPFSIWFLLKMLKPQLTEFIVFVVHDLEEMNIAIKMIFFKIWKYTYKIQ